ncbi:MAG: lipocalin-like domain-containing protein [Chloroflexota bacterium]|nr:lipocalin-like domain-containing protein [Chloroflexota bacterium]
MDRSIEGFWQVIFDDADEGVRPLGTGTLAVREAACWIYVGDRYMEFRAHKDRVVPERYPPSQQEAAAMFRSHRAVAGRYVARRDGASLLVSHEPDIAVDPRMEATRYEHAVELDGDTATAHVLSSDGTRGEQYRWRRLSGRGSSPLAGGWETGDEMDRWMYLVTAAHYGVMRADLSVLADWPRTLSPSDDEAAAFFAARSLNAGAHLLAAKTMDHWPMYGSTTGYEMRKHPTFWLPEIGRDEFLMSFAPEDDAGRWWRVA